MPEDAPGNPGAVRSPTPAAQQAAQCRTVREMQAELHRWAGEDHSRRFGDLFNLVYDLDFLAEAWLRVKANAGSRTPGIDKATVADIENRIGAGAFLEQIRDLLKSGEFRPVAVRQVMIGQDVQVSPAPEPGHAHPGHQPHARRVGELLPALPAFALGRVPGAARGLGREPKF